jgi:hypothetical protein
VDRSLGVTARGRQPQTLPLTFRLRSTPALHFWRLDKDLYLVVVSTTFDPDDYELRWPPWLFVDEAERVRGRKNVPRGYRFGHDQQEWASDMEWLLTEAFVSTVPAESFRRVTRASNRDPSRTEELETWVSHLVEQAAQWPEPGTRKPYWSTRTANRSLPVRLNLDQTVQAFVRLVVGEFKADGYLDQIFGNWCVDDQGGPELAPAEVLSGRLGYEVEWPLETVKPDLDDFCDLVEVFHDIVSRPSTRWYHEYSGCGWHYSAFATGPARRLYRWRVNRLLATSTLGLRLAEEGEDVGRLVRVEPTGLEDLPERALRAATPQTIDRVQHAIALFRARTAGVEDRRSAVIALAGVLEERRALLKAELLPKDEGALFAIANGFAIRHQRADQRRDYDPAFLDWLFWWYLDTVQLTDQVLRRQATEDSERTPEPSRKPRPG